MEAKKVDMSRVTVSLPSWKGVTQAASVAVVGALVVWFMFWTWKDYSSEVQIIPWTPGTAEAQSPYLCFAALKGKRLLALDCLDTSLTQAVEAPQS